MVAMPGVNSERFLIDIWEIYIYRFDQWWFLHAIAVVFLVVAYIDASEMMSTFRQWLFWLITASLLSLVVPPSQVNVTASLYLFPYFFLGCGMKRFHDKIVHPQLSSFVAAAFVLGLILQQMVWFQYLSLNITLQGFFGLLVGLSGTYTLIRYRRRLPLMPTMGKYSYSIYLFHLFGIAFAARLLPKLVTTPHAALVVLTKMACALLLPILAELVLMRIKVLRFTFLGLR
jgi:peptidoglycan/LPS O-acetylase OafA/YrhL